MADAFRTEKDSMGEVQLPAQALYGASTQRAVDNFPVSGWRFQRDFIRVLGLLKAGCAQVNQDLGKLDSKLGKPILQACEEISDGKHDAQFVVDIFQTGSGTSTNMNFNEVAANLANLALGSKLGAKTPVHPNDHVNLGQSSNDVIPTAMHLCVAVVAKEKLIPALRALQVGLAQKATEFMPLVKTGRTHLMDATPIRLGQEFSGYANQIKKGCERIERALTSLYELAIGGTAVGTGINTHKEFGGRVVKLMAQRLKLPFVEAENHFEAQASKDGCVELSGALKTVAVSLFKIANDLRWLSSGPRNGIGEIQLPETQAGSSIMPGKVNPVIAESVMQVCAQVIGNDATITWAGANGNFELNTMMPVMAHSLLCSLDLLTNVCRIFDQKCVRGLTADKAKIQHTVDRSLMMVTSLVPLIGYDKVAEIAKKALAQNRTIRDVALELSGLSKEKLDSLLDAAKMTEPGAET